MVTKAGISLPFLYNSILRENPTDMRSMLELITFFGSIGIHSVLLCRFLAFALAQFELDNSNVVFPCYAWE